ncbi:LacI family DNA-binding transcriptional regulator [Chitinophaga sancti]|uniref:LacI family DNA-binding transcriptional regulator n=1 Tax=Chitinophaga sancti TaxID=1004 RepID=UPI002A74C07C|nr:LacI family DNA-binding transcriptional regulator [Chitinophaga sancti]WPQ66527.1 LacI family DNA-binding transcriptional regulator [Chitinophaga sancti]
MKFEAATIKDIANALGLSTSTVSRALRDSHEISIATKQLVLEYATRINYHPNPIALSLKEKRSRSIGVIVAEIANSFFSQAINGIESVAKDKGYNVIISQTHESFEKELMTLQYLASRSIDGLLISVSSGTQNLEHLKALHDRGFPIVFFDRIVEDLQTHKVMVDNFRGAYDATLHLVNKGYKHIAVLAGPENLSISRERVAGYMEALAQSRMKPSKSMIRYSQFAGLYIDEVEQCMNQLLKLRPRPDAIFTASDKLTTNCMRILNAKGIRIPEEMALVGFSNSDLVELLNPPLTVVRQPAFEMGQIATGMLLQLVESKKPVKEFERKILATTLIVQAST